jgi:hypothetical protein
MRSAAPVPIYCVAQFLCGDASGSGEILAVAGIENRA